MTKQPLHRVVGVDDLIDPALVRHTYPGYSNEVCVGTTGDQCIHDMKIMIDSASSCKQSW